MYIEMDSESFAVNVNKAITFARNGVTEWELKKNAASGFMTASPAIAADRVLVPDPAVPGSWVDLVPTSTGGSFNLTLPVQLETMDPGTVGAVPKNIIDYSGGTAFPFLGYEFPKNKTLQLFGRVHWPKSLLLGPLQIKIYYTVVSTYTTPSVTFKVAIGSAYPASLIPFNEITYNPTTFTHSIVGMAHVRSVASTSFVQFRLPVVPDFWINIQTANVAPWNGPTIHVTNVEFLCTASDDGCFKI